MPSFTRQEIRKILGEAYTEEMETALVKLHRETLDPIKDERDEYKAQAGKLNDLQTRYDALKESAGYKERYEQEHAAFESYKESASKAEALAKKRDAYRILLNEEHVFGDEDRISAILRVTDLESATLDENGHLNGEEGLRQKIRTEWKGFITTTGERGAPVATPPKVDKPKRTKEEILAIKDTAERQRAIAENMDLFGR